MIHADVVLQSAQKQRYLLEQLHPKIDFQGFVMTDWAGQHSGVSLALAGLDMTMPGDMGFDSGT